MQCREQFICLQQDGARPHTTDDEMALGTDIPV